MTKFTRGNLEIKDDSRQLSVRGNGRLVAVLGNANMVENAHLIKTAPKLYAMLDNICELANTDDQTIADEMIQNFDDIEKLLAEARGDHE